MSHFARSSLIVAVFFGLDKVLAFGRAVAVNREFGLGYELDVFNAANNIPDLLSSLISGGALGVALIPVLSEYLEQKGRPAVWDLFSRIANLAFIVTGTIAIFVALLAPWLVANVIASGFPAEQQALTVELMRLDLFAILIFSISGLVMAGLQANQHFLFPALAPSLYNVGQIFGALVLAREEPFPIGTVSLPAYGLGIRGLVYGVIIGAGLHLLIQVPGLIRHGFRWTKRIDFQNPGVRQVLRLLAPRITTMFFIQMFLIIRDNLASGLEEGAVTALTNGWFIMQVPETLLGTAIAIALLPTISEIFALGESEEFRRTVNGAARAVIAFTIPAAVLIAVGAPAVVQSAFEYTLAETAQVMLATRIYLLGLTGHALLEISARSFYAQQDARTPLFAAALNAFLYLVLANLLSNAYGFAGIALANVIAFTTEALLLLYLLQRRFPGIVKTRDTLVRVTAAAAAAGAALFFVLRLPVFGTMEIDTAAIVTAGLMLVGLAAVVPFIMPEVRLMLKIGNRLPSVPPPDPAPAK